MMPQLKGGLFTAAVFHQTAVLLLLTRCCAGQSQLVGPSQPIVAIVGDDLILPCHLEPADDASGMTVEWTRPDLNPRFVHVWRDGVELESKKHPSYRGRTSLFVNNLKDGDISLKLSKVKLSDEGKYRCFIPALSKESTVELVVGQSQLVGPSQPIVAIVGDDIILSCHLKPAVDASDMIVEWVRPDLDPRFVHVWRDGVEPESEKHPSYRGRTSLFVNNLKHGDISLKLSKVKLSDEGKYRCFIPALSRESTVELVVGVISTIVISLARTQNEDISGLVLQCESEGWYPEPEVLWLDAEGHVLSAGPTETVRGPDGLYTVSSRVTVEKRHRNNFTCRVQQKNINQTRETQIRIPEDVLMAHDRGSDVRISVVLTVVCLLLFAAGFNVFLKLRQKKRHNEMNHDKNTEDRTGETEELVQESTTVKDLDEEKLEEKEEEKKDMTHVISVLMEQKKELENDRDKLISQLEEVNKQT